MHNSNRSSTENKTISLIASAAVFMLAAAILNICLGASRISLLQLWEALVSGPGPSAASRILWYVRLPRTAACLLAGAGLAVSGTVIQKVLANNLLYNYSIGKAIPWQNCTLISTILKLL